MKPLEAFDTLMNALSRRNTDDLELQAEPPNDIDLPMQKSDFCDAAKKREASRDVGAQLFCALLRSVGVDVRLTCSLQVLPINASAIAKTTPAKKPMSVAYYRSDQKIDSADEAANTASSRENTPKPERSRPLVGSTGGRNRFGSPMPTEAVRPSINSKQRMSGPSSASRPSR